MLSVKQGRFKYLFFFFFFFFLSLWYDTTWDWTLVSWTIGKHSTHKTNGPVHLNSIKPISQECVYSQTQSAEAKFGIIFKTFFVWLIQFLKKCNKSKFSWLASSTISLKFSWIWVSKKRNDKESMICLMLKLSQKYFRNNYSFLMVSIKPRL